MVIGITGGIATGKSTFSNYLKDRGYHIIDADKISHEIIKEKKVIDKIVNKFGKDILDKYGKIDRKILRVIVFKDKEKLKILNSIMHPAIINRIEDEIKLALSKEKIVFVDMPLLYELKLEYLVDKVVVIYSSKDIQIKRVMSRDKSEIDVANAIIDNQMDIEIKKMKSDYLIENIESIEKFYDEINKFLGKIK